jgi:transcriptional regulator with XRE-family HTH domain
MLKAGDNKKDYDRLLEEERLILDATELIYELMERESINQKELARRLGKSKGFVSQVLNGSRNMTLRTFADLLGVLGYRAELNARPVSEPVGRSKDVDLTVFLDQARWAQAATGRQIWRTARERSSRAPSPAEHGSPAFFVELKRGTRCYTRRGGGPTLFWSNGHSRRPDSEGAEDESTESVTSMVA